MRRLLAARLTPSGGASHTGSMPPHAASLPFQLDPVIAEAKRRTRRRRLFLLGVIVATTCLAVGFALAFRPSSPSSKGAVPGIRAQPRDRTVLLGNLTMRIPVGWHVRRVKEDCADAYGPGVLVGDVTQRRLREISHPRIVNGCSTQWNMSRLGEKYAVVAIDAGVGFPSPIPPSAFPLGLNGFGLAPPTMCHCAIRSSAVNAGRLDYDFRTYLGVDASATERSQLAAVIRSVRPTRSRVSR
jgi:hypothetical protein